MLGTADGLREANLTKDVGHTFDIGFCGWLAIAKNVAILFLLSLHDAPLMDITSFHIPMYYFCKEWMNSGEAQRGRR